MTSRPVWGAWIEIYLDQIVQYLANMSRPVWGAWIEIFIQSSRCSTVSGRAPYGARGLKLLRICIEDEPR